MFGGAAGTGTRGQSEPLGYLLVFALVVTGVGLTVLVGGTGLVETQSQSELQRAEHSMTLLDSRAAMVALGDASSQTVSLGHDSGQMQVDQTSGWMSITHRNYTTDPSQSYEEEIFNESLGTVTYENHGRTLAYQGGGVWQRDEDGQARMVSPPEFHYRGQTLTLPVIRTLGNGSKSGRVSVSVTPEQQARTVFANASADYDQGNLTYRNPIKNGSVYATVRSEYYEGWARYFEDRTAGEVTTWDNNNTVQVELIALGGPPGEFDLPDLNSEDYVPAGGIDGGHPVSVFQSDVVFEGGGGTYEFSYWYEAGGKQWELHVSPDNSDLNPNNFDCSNDEPNVVVSQYYYDGNPSGDYEYWEVELDPTTTSAVEWNCVGNDKPQLTVDFTSNDAATEMAYDDSKFDSGSGNPGQDDLCDGNQWCFAEDIKDNSLNSSAELAGHGEGCEPTGELNPGDATNCTVGTVVNHYMSVMGPNMDIYARDGPGNSNPVDADRSGGTLMYDEADGAEYVTYLHITENEVSVDLD